MTLSAKQLEWIVGEVIRRLRAEPTLAAGNGSAAAGGALALNDRLVTLTTLRGRLDGVRSVRVPSGAVVTPAVRDELKQRGIELMRS